MGLSQTVAAISEAILEESSLLGAPDKQRFAGVECLECGGAICDLNEALRNLSNFGAYHYACASLAEILNRISGPAFGDVVNTWDDGDNLP